MANKLYNFACDLDFGRAVGCKDVVGGLKKIFLVKYEEGFITKLGFNGSNVNQIDEIASTPDVVAFEFDLRTETSSSTVNINSDDATGTYFNEQILELTLQKIAARDLPLIDILGGGKFHAFALDNNDNCYLYGTLYGMTLTAGAMQTGTAKADLSGFTITLTGREPHTYILKASAGPGTANYPFDGLNPEDISITPGSYPL